MTQTPTCFGSPTSINLAQDSLCRKCPHLAKCGRSSLDLLLALARVAPVQDLADTLHTQLQGLGLVPAGEVGVSPSPDAQEAPTLPGESPQRSFGRIRRKELTQQELDLLERLPVKVAKRMRPLMRAGLFNRLAPDMKAGRNPFPTTENEFLNRFASWLLQGGQVIKKDARDRFIKVYGWTDMTAASHVSVAVTLFVTLGIAKDSGDRIIRT